MPTVANFESDTVVMDNGKLVDSWEWRLRQRQRGSAMTTTKVRAWNVEKMSPGPEREKKLSVLRDLYRWIQSPDFTWAEYCRRAKP